MKYNIVRIHMDGYIFIFNNIMW